jgi:isopenicillin N synthase-like dioxygenase
MLAARALRSTPYLPTALTARALTAAASLPIVDVSPLLAATRDSAPSGAAVTADQLSAARALHSACTTHGFFMVENHGVSPDLQARLLDGAARFFALDEATKEELSIGGANPFRGFQRLGLNVTKGKRDAHEGLDLFRELPFAGGADGAAGLGEAGLSPVDLLVGTRNQLPCEGMVPGFADTLHEYEMAMTTLGHALMRGVALGLELPPDHFRASCADVFWIMRVIHYPVAEEPAAADILANAANATGGGSGGEGGGGEGEGGGEGCGVHTDYGNLTMICQNDSHAGVLQVQSADGSWIEANPPPGALCCNLGDMLHRWTNGLYQSTPHRVVAPSSATATGLHPPGTGRISVPFFFETNLDTLVKPLLTDATGHTPRFEPVVFQDHLLEKLTGNFAPEAHGSEAHDDGTNKVEEVPPVHQLSELGASGSDKDISDAAQQLEVGGSAMPMDAMGPVVVHTNGSVSRISNWHEMSGPERETTMRVVGRRNQVRMEKLRAEAAEAEDDAVRDDRLDALTGILAAVKGDAANAAKKGE